MTMSSRDKKIAFIVAPVVVLLAYWFLLLTPQREEASTAAADKTTQEQRRDAAQQRIDALTAAKSTFASDYAEMVRLGKAVPAKVDMPSLLVQLESAAAGTDIDFQSIVAEPRQAATVAAPATDTPGSGDGSEPVDAGGAPAQSAPGAAGEAAGNTVAGANAASSSAEQSGLSASDTQTSAPAREGSLPIGGGTAVQSVDATGATGPAGLDTVPLTFEFTGDFFDLASFFHRLKRYVESDRNQVYVRGRLLTIDAMDFESDPERFPALRATVHATAYLAPVSEGPLAGATPAGPEVTPVADPAQSASVPAPPTATATP
jgi:hypothetical protein